MNDNYNKYSDEGYREHSTVIKIPAIVQYSTYCNIAICLLQKRVVQVLSLRITPLRATIETNGRAG